MNFVTQIAPPGVLLRERPSLKDYVVVVAIVSAGVALLVTALQRTGLPAAPRELLKPVIAMFALTAVVWSSMLLWRNIAVFLRRASIRYYQDYRSDPPDEWIERPARAFNNLMQLPTLFYVIAILMMITPWADRAQIDLAWMFIGVRAAHAANYIAFNYLPFRFAFYSISCVALAVMWARFAINAPMS